MTDSNLLESKIKSVGLTITRAGFYKKLNNHSEFKASEISKLSSILELSDSERESIFFACCVDN